MEIYIDNEKFEPRKNNKKNIGKILKEITKKIEKNQKIIRNIYFNGIELEGETIIDSHGTGVIEVETKSYTDLIFESLENCREYIKMFFENNEILNLKLEYNEQIIERDVEEIQNFLIWFTDLLYLLDEVYDFSLRNDEFNEIGAALLQEMVAITEKKAAKDFNSYVTYLDFYIVDYLKKFMENIDYYLKIILEDERQKIELA